MRCRITPARRPFARRRGSSSASLHPLPDVGPGDRVIVPGFPLADHRVPPKLVSWLRQAARAGAEMCSVCTGAFALGEAGVLDGRTCTTHWRRVAELRARFPRARVVGDRLFIEDDGVVTSAGIAAGIDMTLALIERDAGPVVAGEVAREMVVYLRRDGAHAQDSVYLDYQTHLSPGIHQVQQHLVSNPATRDTLEQLADIAGMSERHLTRVFKRATGISIHDYREQLRLARARDLMRNPTLTLDAVAVRVRVREQPTAQARLVGTVRRAAERRPELAYTSGQLGDVNGETGARCNSPGGGPV